MKIQYLPLHHMNEITHINSVACEQQSPGISVWKYGQIKDISEDLKFRENIRGQVSYIVLLDDLLADNAFKVVSDKSQSKNPNFQCSICGVESLEEAIVTQVEQGIPLEIDGRRTCKKCFLKRSK